ncbi:MAG TPA: hypothetical protein VH438_08320 [Gemmatimonadales bacterium]|jgi:hypothetical protein
MATQKPESATPIPNPEPVPVRRSDALEAELAMLEAILPQGGEGSAQPKPVDSASDRGGTR